MHVSMLVSLPPRAQALEWGGNGSRATYSIPYDKPR